MAQIITSAKLGERRSSATPQNKLALTSGEKVKTKRRHPVTPPPPAVLTIGKLISLEFTLARYRVTPNAVTTKRLNGGER